MEIVNKRIDNYEVLKTLGKGSTCKVYLCKSLQTNEKFALKVYFDTKIHTFEVEAKSLTKVQQHPNIILIHEYVRDGKYFKPNKEPKSVTYLVLELCKNGEIFDYISNLGPFPEPIARKYFLELISGIETLHESGQVHRDIKPENIFLSDDFNLKLADFGYSAPLEGRDGSGYLHSFKGTRPYMAPEILERKPYSGQSADLFSSGIILFIFIYARPPFARAERVNPHYVNIFNKNWERFWRFHTTPTSPTVSEDFKDLIQKIFPYDPAERMNLETIKTHPWVLGTKATNEECKKFMRGMGFEGFSETQEKSDCEEGENEYRGKLVDENISLSLSRGNSYCLAPWEETIVKKCRFWFKGEVERGFQTIIGFLTEKGRVEAKGFEFEARFDGVDFDATVEICKWEEKYVVELSRIQGDRWKFYELFDELVNYMKNIYSLCN